MSGNAQEIITLYPEGIVCSSRETAIEPLTLQKINKQITNPQLWYFPVAVSKENIPAILIIPGGGYKNLAFEHEGIKVAKWLNTLGVHAFVLMYRTPHWEFGACKSNVALLDAQRAMQIINNKAKKWDIDTSKIGVMGFSAGGHLSATLSNQFDYNSSNDGIQKINFKPNYCMLLYPVISMQDELTHLGSRISLLGHNPKPKDINFFSNELQVRKDTPPTLLIHAEDDSIVNPKNSIIYYNSLQKNNIPSKLHLLKNGGHGFGITSTQKPTQLWLELAKNWLIQRGVIAD
ncbi:alpha/beta hydrolase [Flavobacteriaceae bacterium]|nr:alpha/beta hydrolase [Flavobacteriaceae bacterium]